MKAGGFVGLLALLFSSGVYAQTCTAPQVAGVKINYVTTGYGFTTTCVQNQTFATIQAARAACHQPDGTVAGANKIKSTVYTNSLNADLKIARVSDNGVIGDLYVSTVAACHTPPVLCTAFQAGDKKFFSGDSPDGLPPDEICEQNCLFTVASVAVGVGTSYGGEFSTAGEGCSANTTQASQPVTGTAKCRQVNGQTVCVGGTIPDDCIRVNGSLTCYSMAGDFCTTPDCSAAAEAVKQPDNSVVAKPTVTTAPVPYGPDGQRQPDAVFGARGPSGAGTTTNYYNSNTVNNSCSGVCAEGETPASQNASCGAPGQPACRNQGDEEIDPDEGFDDGEEDGEGAQFITPAGDYDFGSMEQEVADKKQEFSDTFDQIKAEAQQSFGSLDESTAQWPKYQVETSLGLFEFDFGLFQEQLNYLALAVILLSLILALIIILS